MIPDPDDIRSLWTCDWWHVAGLRPWEMERLTPREHAHIEATIEEIRRKSEQ